MKIHQLLIAFGTVLLVWACNDQPKNVEKPIETEPKEAFYQAISFTGDTLYASAVSEKLQAQFIEKQQAYLADSTDLEKLIWYGRFTAYTGDYRGAIDIYSEGLKQFPNNSRLLRHRGHRQISIRQLDKAIADLERATNVILDETNSLEDDGMPNAEGIRLTTKHGNIFYHLGLAHYLKGNYESSLMAYQKCLELSQNNDGLVSATHWIVLSLKALGRDDEIAAYLEPIKQELEVIENASYLNACLFYKGVKPLDELYNPEAEINSSNSALKYGLARWSYLNEKQEQAMMILKDILDGDDWASFGYIAAEVDLSRMQ
ncbi:tetratricopeptide repeat protein [Gilvibacter sp.]|uniref:tetratricopeptide repeat protein n=1 Tax=Gilvibacter sp. TaxID=2729997 RepID=UPI0025C3A6CA|nr:tetratricopeptide repeat protein [Gilvibacter sp.]NQX76487.1 hypothetical protein [Gilvibacter sp.]